MLMVLAEFDCLRYLQDKGVYPDEFFTDFQLFKNRVLVKNDVDVMIILGGNSHFGKRVIQEYILNIIERINDVEDGSISSLMVLTDIVLPKVPNYYKYSMFLEDAKECHGWSQNGETRNVLLDYQTEKKDTKTFYEKVNVSEMIESIKNVKMKEAELLEVIQIPVFRQQT